MDKTQIDKSQNYQDRDSPKKKYSTITYQVFNLSIQMRKELIRQVKEEKLSIYRASRNLGIKNCTAKAIIREFRKRGHVYRRKEERKRKKKVITDEIK